MKFYYYAMRVDFSKEKVKWYNIFDNGIVAADVEKEVKKYVKAPSKYKHLVFNNRSWLAVDQDGEYTSGFDGFNDYIYGYEAFKYQMRLILMNQFWARCEYEFLVTSWPPSRKPKSDKVDVWYQLEPNLDVICHEVIRQYKEHAKKARANKEEEDIL